ncbi:unnamed protein product [Linum trigynum]|uniref:Pentatricopeptide repeat-containing protein n=1 Tax=Linum trigynum TaxID=586398 RepID=A0AAV2FK32_9ROSI
MNQLKQLHAHTLRKGIDQGALIGELLQVPNILYAQKVFDQIPKPHVFLYNKLIQAYSSHKEPHRCLHLFSQMCRTRCRPNEHTFTFLFAACASFSSPIGGQVVHGCFVKSGFASDFIASTALVDAYAKLRSIGSARRLFDEMPVRDIPTWNSLIAGYGRCGDMNAALEIFKSMPRKSVVSWTAMISGYSQNGLYSNALEFFLKMEEEEDVKPNEVTIASVLPACANLGALEVGERIDAYARANGLFKNSYVSNALLEMYSKCGKISIARDLFHEMGKRRNLCSWNSMIMGLAVHGSSNEVLGLYDEMLKEGTAAPDDVTFVGLLLACTHGGRVARGRQLFQSMEMDFGISPKLEHYGCMVDLLGRAGELKEAYDLVKRMPMKPDSVIWGALLGACSFHNKNVELAEVSAEALFELEPWNPGNYVILSNIYASAGRWDGVAKLRKLMKGGQITKAAGYSFIEVTGRVHKFLVEDASHPTSDEIYSILKAIYSAMEKHKDACDFVSELEELCSME